MPPGDGLVTGSGAGEPDSGGLVWHRMHPVTPVLNAWKIIVALLVFALWQLGPQAAQDWGLEGRRALVILAALVLGGGAIGAGYAAVAWRMTRYAVDADRVYLQSGVLFRRQRQARLDRVQAIDVVQPLLARIVGLAQLIVEQAGGNDSRVVIAFLTEARAHELRNELLARAAGIDVDGAEASLAAGDVPAAGGAPAIGAPATGVVAAQAGPGPSTGPGAVVRAPEAPEREMYAVPIGRMLASIALSGAMVTFVVMFVAIGASALATRSWAAFVVVLPALFASGGYVWTRFTGEFGFRAAISPDGIRLRHGLTEARAQTVPPGRVQAVRLSQPLLWRAVDWWRVQVNVAGYADADAQRESVLLPVGTREEALLALWLVLPDLGEPEPRTVLEAALTGRGSDEGFVPSPRRARWLDPVGWRRNGLRVTPAALLLRRGRVWRRVDVVPHERTQSLGLAQGPLQRRLRLSSLLVHSTPGPVSPRVDHLDAATVADLVMAQAERAAAARRAAPPARWMRRP